MTDLAAIKAEAARLKQGFEAAGAVPVETALLQPAATLLDLYGEDIRGRAYVVQDPLKGELMLRPDFTVPVVQWHMDEGAEPARYTYAGEVFRRQEEDEGRANEYFQAGFEIFGEDEAAADAEVFARIAAALDGLPVRPVTGDIGILSAALAGLDTTERRKAALMRHLWHPRRFRALLERFGGQSPVPEARAALLAADDPLAAAPAFVGLRGRDEVAERIEALRQDAATPPISAADRAALDRLLKVEAAGRAAVDALAAIARDLPSIAPAIERVARRLDALEGQGVDISSLAFETAFGRTSMEYYDGFVFGFMAAGRDDLPPVATGGRYDALTARLGRGRSIRAVGGVIRPGLTLEIAP